MIVNNFSVATEVKVEWVFASLKSTSLAKNWQGSIVPIKFVDNFNVTVSLGTEEAVFSLNECHLLSRYEYEQIELLEILTDGHVKWVPKGGIERYLSSFSRPSLPIDSTLQFSKGSVLNASTGTLAIGDRVQVIQPEGLTASVSPPAPGKPRDVYLSPELPQSPGEISQLSPVKSTSQNCEVVERATNPIKNTSQNCEVVERATNPVKSTSQICEVMEVEIADLWPKEENSPEAMLLQPRSGLDSSAVERYAAWLEAESEAPPVEVMEIDGLLWLVHGNHRKAAALKVGRTHIKALVREGSWSEAVAIASTANLSNGLQLNRDEIETACKNFLRVCENLPVSAVQSQLEELNRKTGKNFKSLSNGAIATLFGYSESTIRNYKKDIQREIALAKFSLQSRVVMLPSEDKQIWLLPLSEKDRMGTVININLRAGIRVQPDNPRLFSIGGQAWWFEPEFLQLTDRPSQIYEVIQCKVGDRVRRFPSGEWGLVVSVSESESRAWDWKAATPESPLIFWDSGIHSITSTVELDRVGTAELPSIVQRIKAAKKAIANLEGEDWTVERQHHKLNLQIQHLLKQITDGEWISLEWAFERELNESVPITPITLSDWLELANQDAPETTYALYGWTFDEQRFKSGLPCLKKEVVSGGNDGKNINEFKSVEAKLRQQGQRWGLKGNGEQQLPDINFQNGKHPENPATTAIGLMESPPAQPAFVQQAAQINNSVGNFQQWSDEQLKQFIKAAQLELARRHQLDRK